MSRIFNQQTLQILREVSINSGAGQSQKLFEICGKDLSYKDFYNTLYRLKQQELLSGSNQKLAITPEGQKLLSRHNPTRDGVWKLVIFDIPEKQKYVRVVLRAKLKALNFKKWQNSIWISPYVLDEEIEKELKELGKKFFVRLIQTKNINLTEDLEKMF